MNCALRQRQEQKRIKRHRITISHSTSSYTIALNLPCTVIELTVLMLPVSNCKAPLCRGNLQTMPSPLRSIASASPGDRNGAHNVSAEVASQQATWQEMAYMRLQRAGMR